MSETNSAVPKKYETFLASPNYEAVSSPAREIFVLDLVSSHYPLEHYASDEELAPFVSENQVRAALKRLRHDGLIEVRLFSETPFDDGFNRRICG